MQLRAIKTSDPTLNRIQDAVAEALRSVPEPLKAWRLQEGPWPTPSSPAVLQLQHFESGQWVTRAAWNTDGTDAKRCAAIYSTTTSILIGSGVYTNINYDTKEIDTDGAVTKGAPGTATWSFKVPAGKGGLYLVSAGQVFSAAFAAEVSLAVFKNGSNVRQLYDRPTLATDSAVPSLFGSCVISLADGDAIGVGLYQNGGSTRATVANYAIGCRVEICRLNGD